MLVPMFPFATAALLLMAAAAAAQHNPVLAGDYPDPSVIRVGEEYWATATTSQWAPLFPLLRSTDLRNWKQAGSVFNERPEWAETNFWAPEIAEHQGRFFVYYTAKKKDGPLCVAVATAEQPAGPYKDHGPMVCQEVGSIDAVPVTDLDGSRWLIWKEDGNSKRQPTPLWIQRLSADGTKLESEPQELFRNNAPWEGQLVEGPFVLRRGDWWYMFYSGAGCCGRQCNYALGVARARKLHGPWEKNPDNPILEGNEHWKCPGHGSVVDDAQGRTWLLYHAYHPKDSIFVGRQGLLDQITWSANGWPVIQGPSAGPYPKLQAIRDDFSGELSPEWSRPAAQKARLETKEGWLSMTASDQEAVAARAPTAADYTARTAVDVSSLGPSTKAGISAWGSRANLIALTADHTGKLTLWRRDQGKTQELTSVPTEAKIVHLRMVSAGGNRFTFSWSADGRRWTEVAPGVSGDSLPPWDLATRMALYVGGEGSTARFDYFRVH